MKENLVSFVASAVERALVEYDPRLKKPTVEAGGLVAGIAAAAVLRLAPNQQSRLATSVSGVEGAVAELAMRMIADTPARSDGKAAVTSPVSIPSPPVHERKPSNSGVNDVSGEITTNWAGPVAGPTFLERNFKISRSSLNRWQRRKHVVALRSGGRKHVFPLAQFVDGRPASGIAEVLELFPSQRVAWLWLSRPSSELDGQIPIDLLKQDNRDAVLEAAKAKLASRQL